MCVTAARPQAASAASGFGTVSSHGPRDGPPSLAGLFSGGMPQLRSRGGAPGVQSAHSSVAASQSDSSTSVSGRTGVYHHSHHRHHLMLVVITKSGGREAQILCRVLKAVAR